MRPARLSDEELLRLCRDVHHDPEAVLSEIRTSIRPGVMRSRRRYRWRARLVRAWELRRLAFIPALVGLMWFSFWRAHGTEGLAAAAMGTSIALAVVGLVLAWRDR
jgi:hypothetical protein